MTPARGSTSNRLRRPARVPLRLRRVLRIGTLCLTRTSCGPTSSGCAAVSLVPNSAAPIPFTLRVPRGAPTSLLESSVPASDTLHLCLRIRRRRRSMRCRRRSGCSPIPRRRRSSYPVPRQQVRRLGRVLPLCDQPRPPSPWRGRWLQPSAAFRSAALLSASLRWRLRRRHLPAGSPRR